MDSFYFYRLPKFVKIFKKELCNKLDKKGILNVKDYIEVFFSFFHQNNAYKHFEIFDIIEKDKMYLGIYQHFENRIYMERDIHIENVDEEYQIQFELILDVPTPEKRISKTFEVERDYLGDFSNREDGYFYFEDFYEKVISADEILNFIDLLPKSLRISINSDF